MDKKLEPKQCKICLKEKLVTYEKLGTVGERLYKSEDGRWWKSRVCPDCQNERRANQRKAKKSNPEGSTQE